MCWLTLCSSRWGTCCSLRSPCAPPGSRSCSRSSPHPRSPLAYCCAETVSQISFPLQRSRRQLQIFALLAFPTWFRWLQTWRMRSLCFTWESSWWGCSSQRPRPRSPSEDLWGFSFKFSLQFRLLWLVLMDLRGFIRQSLSCVPRPQACFSEETYLRWGLPVQRSYWAQSRLCGSSRTSVGSRSIANFLPGVFLKSWGLPFMIFLRLTLRPQSLWFPWRQRCHWTPLRWLLSTHRLPT